jgi:elongation factor Ts
VAKTPEFKELAHYLAMQVASMSPLYVAAADIPAAEKARVTKEAEDEVKKDAKNAKKPAEVVAKIVEGKVAKYFEEKVLMTQG